MKKISSFRHDTGQQALRDQEAREASARIRVGSGRSDDPDDVRRAPFARFIVSSARRVLISVSVLRKPAPTSQMKALPSHWNKALTPEVGYKVREQ